MSGRIWLIRPKPEEDELFSSWLVRLAWGNAVKLQTFCVKVLSLPPNFWVTDVDHHPSLELMSKVAKSTATPIERVQQMDFSSFDGILWLPMERTLFYPWVMPVIPYGRHRREHGQQYCRLCLASDKVPYFRRHWRLAFNVVCDKHHVYLEDSCPQCGNPVEFHGGDFGKRLLDAGCPITRCSVCGIDFRQAFASSDRYAPDNIIIFQRRLNALVKRGWGHDFPGARLYSSLFFSGFRTIVQLLASIGQGRRLYEHMSLKNGELPLSVSSTRSGVVFEQLRVGDRAHILQFCSELLTHWPSEFIKACKLSRISCSYMKSYRGIQLPYWLQSEIDWYLYDRDYSPSSLERKAVQRFLQDHGYPAAKNNVNRWLGVTAVGKSEFGDFPTRWNPRGPRNKVKRE